MTKRWCRLILLFMFTYGPFLIFQSFLDVWPTKQMHSLVMLLGGITVLLWAVRYFIKRPKVVIYGIEAYCIATVVGFTLLIPILVVAALIRGN